MRKIIITFICIFLLTASISAVLLSDQGTNVKNSTGTLLSSANLTIEIYNATSGGTLILNQTFTDAIINGSWNLMLNASLEFGERYWKNYKINDSEIFQPDLLADKSIYLCFGRNKNDGRGIGRL